MFSLSALYEAKCSTRGWVFTRLGIYWHILNNNLTHTRLRHGRGVRSPELCRYVISPQITEDTKEAHAPALPRWDCLAVWMGEWLNAVWSALGPVHLPFPSKCSWKTKSATVWSLSAEKAWSALNCPSRYCTDFDLMWPTMHRCWFSSTVSQISRNQFLKYITVGKKDSASEFLLRL